MNLYTKKIKLILINYLMDFNNFDDLSYYVMTIIIGSIFLFIGMIILKKTNNWKYDFSILGILSIICGGICFLPLIAKLYMIAMWLFFIGIILYILFKLFESFNENKKD